ncbi:MAG: S9 family peptidase [Nitrospirota bacterium]|nr:S9 family peptidase [Nitrospirota bacterium]
MIAPYGSWKSPLTSDRIVSESVRLGQLAVESHHVYWIENCPGEGGRNTVIQLAKDPAPQALIPSPFNVRTRVHEYGGGAYVVFDGTIYFSNFSDQRLYRFLHPAPPEPITPTGPYCFADGIIDPQRHRMICIQEDHTQSDREPVNTIVSIPLDIEPDGHAGTILVSGNDFYSSPRLSPDGCQLAWLTWNHPNMPWDGTELWIAKVNSNGGLSETRRIAGGSEISIFQPEWSPDGILHYVSDESGWWNLYRSTESGLQPLCPMEAEFGEPQWVFGLRTYAFESATTIICTYAQNGENRLARLHPSSGSLEPFDLPFTEFSDVHVTGTHMYCIASAPSTPTALIRLNLTTREITVLRQSIDFSLDPQYISTPEAIAFPTARGKTAHAIFYPPKNGDYQAPEGERSPLVVKSHGGPTGSASTAFNLMIQYWTSRGIAVLDVNYGGSTGYGRAYRERLNGQWGIVDAEDCVNAVRHLVDRGSVDPARITITGGSAGGYTTLCALTFHDCFTAGSSYYGVSDLEALARDTHKFESRYLDRLVGPYPERRDVYRQRSPIHFTDRLSCPLILFQGLEDKVVPPNQAEEMFQAVKTKGLPVAYIAFEGEQHGFRRAENIKQVLDNELYFYSRIFEFEPADMLVPITIANF